MSGAIILTIVLNLFALVILIIVAYDEIEDGNTKIGFTILAIVFITISIIVPIHYIMDRTTRDEILDAMVLDKKVEIRINNTNGKAYYHLLDKSLITTYKTAYSDIFRPFPPEIDK